MLYNILDTCKCPKYIFNNWYELKPYSLHDPNIETEASGLFPDLLDMVVGAVCTDCISYKPSLFYNKTKNGRASLKHGVGEVKEHLNEFTHISFPIFGRFTITRFQGDLPYIGFVQSQGSALLVYQPRTKTIGVVAILIAVANAWPVIVIAVLLACMSGWIIWFLVGYIFLLPNLKDVMMS